MKKEHKSYFRRPTKTELVEGREKVRLERGLVYGLEQLADEDYGMIKEGVFNFDAWETAKKFMKHGPELQLHRFRSIDQAVRFAKTPTEIFRKRCGVMRQKRSARRRNYKVSSYSFRPLSGNDKRKRRVPLVEVLKAARIMDYVKNSYGYLELERQYNDAKTVGEEGDTFIVSLPSTYKRRPRHRLALVNVPIRGNSKHRFVLPYMIKAKATQRSDSGNGEQEVLDIDYYSGVKTYREMRYPEERGRSRVPYEKSDYNYVSAHEIAAYRFVGEEMTEKGNKTVAKFSPYPVPNQRLIDFYLTLRDRTLKEISYGEKTRLTHLNEADIETMLWGFVQKHGYNSAFEK